MLNLKHAANSIAPLVFFGPLRPKFLDLRGLTLR